jgi:hypothetical protein
MSRLTGCSILVVVMAACDEPSAPNPQDFAPNADVVAAACDVLPTLKAHARGYVPAGDFADVELLLITLGNACGGGEVAGTTTTAWQLIRRVETIAQQGTGGDLAAGSNFVNGLLACTLSPCLASAVPGIDLSAALGPAGVFAVRAAGDPRNAIAHSPVPLVDFDNNPVQALWGVEVTQAWPNVVFAPIVLIHGAPAANLALQDVSIGGLQIAMNIFPDAGRFRDGALQVGICFSAEITLPHVADDHSRPSLLPRVQREGVLLEERTPGFCPTSGTIGQASLAGSLPARIRALAAAALPALFRSDRKITVIGGTPLDFSTFAPVAANPEGYLEIVSQPDPVVQTGQSIGTLRIRALSGAGTPLEKVSVALWVVGPQGTVNGALAGTLRKLTVENDAAFGTVTFDNPFRGAAGTYRICAAGSAPEFTFRAVCSVPMQVN